MYYVFLIHATYFYIITYYAFLILAKNLLYFITYYIFLYVIYVFLYIQYRIFLTHFLNDQTDFNF